MSAVPTAQHPGTRPGLLPTLLRVAVHGTTAFVFAWPLTMLGAALAAMAGAALGAAAGVALARTTLRLPVALGALAVGLLAVGLLRSVAVDLGWLPSLVGPATALLVGEALAFGLGAAAVSAGLRMASSRHASFAIVEACLVALAFAQLVIAHRHGAINRPFELADPIIARGADPTLALFTLGVGAAIVLVLLLLSERSLARSALHLLVVGLLLFLVIGTAAVVGAPGVPQSGGGLGLRGDPDGQGGSDRNGDQRRRNNEQLRFRDNYDSAQNRVPLGVVILHDDYSPPEQVYYFRQAAFSLYNGRRLVMAGRADADRDLARTFPTSVQPVEQPPASGAFRMSVETTVALLADHPRPFALESPVELRPAPNPNPQRFKRLYRVQSSARTADYTSLLGRPAGDPTWGAAQWAHYTEGPEDPRYRALALQILTEVLSVADQGDPMSQALAISWWLGNGGTYSLRSSHAGAEDPTADFLFGDLTGYCVHFAHAATYLMRSVGLPARIATGYAVDEAARRGGSAMIVSGQDSHAWPEVYVEEVGWVIVDVTPAQTLSPSPQPPDPDLQRLLGELMRGQSPLPAVAPPTPVDQLARAALRWAGIVAGWALLAALAFLVAAQQWRRLAPAFASRANLPRVAYRAALDRLAEVQLRRRLGESREAFAVRVQSQVPDFESLTRIHVAAAFGGSALATGDPRALARVVQRQRRAHFPWWRRWLGGLAPWSWLLAR